MAGLRDQGLSKRQIAAKLDRSPSTISRELNRNSSRQDGYRPGYADDQAWSRRWRGSKLDRDPALRHTVYACLQGGWSPEQVAGRLALEAGRTIVSHETIYPLHPGPNRPPQGLFLAQPAAPPQGQAGPPRAQGRQFHFLYPPASAHLPAPSRSRRPRYSRPLGSRPDALWQPGPVPAHPPGTLLPPAAHPSPDHQGLPGRGRCHHPTAGSLPSPVAPVRRLRQRHRVRPPLPTPRPGYPDLLLRPPLPLAEGRRGECQRPAAPFPPPQDRPVPVAPGLHLPGHPSPQPHPAQVPGLPDPGRNLIQTAVALEM